MRNGIVLALLVSAGPSLAQNVTFGAGSLIVPMDQCYNPSPASASVVATDWVSGACGTAAVAPTCYSHSYGTGDLRLPYGLVYLLAVNHIPVYLVDNPSKLRLSDADIVVSPSVGATAQTVTYLNPSSGHYLADGSALGCGANPVSYWGMPFVVDASYTAEAVAVIDQFNNNPSMYVGGNTTTFAPVPLHVVNYAFSANVIGVIASRPKPVGISQSTFFDTFFDESGISAVVPWGTAAVHLTETQNPTASNGFVAQYSFPCASGTCAQLMSGAARLLDVLWTDDNDLQFWSGLGSWFAAGGRALVVGQPNGGGSGVLPWETGTAASMSYLSTGGLSGSTRTTANFCPADVDASGNAVVGPPSDYPASDPLLQLGDLLFDPVGAGSSSVFHFKPGSTASTPGLHALWGGGEFGVLAGHPRVNGAATAGGLVYLGGSNSWHGSAGRKDSGLHIMFNSLVAPSSGGAFTPVELSRSTPVGRDNGAFYVGTFDWNVPADPTAFGNLLYQPRAGSYPYVTGHFRQYSAAASTASLACDPTVAGASCSWDAARSIPAFAQRNIYVVTGSSLTPARNLTASDATIRFVANNIGTKFGGVDFGTAAVIETRSTGSVTVAGAAQRPTIAYVGARDGMLHAICVAPGPGDTACYGRYQPGAEIWAIIPASVKSQMDAALVAGDWSQVNVGGAVRVADVVDTFNGSGSPTSARTVLLVGTRESGSVLALDVSNPLPSSTTVNADGFKILFESSLGPTVGGSFSFNGTSATAVVTAAPASRAGINTYVFHIADGTVLAANQKLYTRSMPTAGGGLAPLPNDVPPMPTIIDLDGDGVDETALVADSEGVVRRIVLTHAGAIQSSATLFDASVQAGCPNGVACQPLGASPSIARLGSTQTLTAFLATGGADWARLPSQLSYIYAFDLTSGARMFAAAFAGVQPPAGATMPLRSYAQLSIAGTDLYAQLTELAVNNNHQLAMPTVFPGTYGTVMRYGGLDATITAGVQLITQGQSFGGSAGAVLETNSSAADGVITIVGTDTAIRTPLAATSTSLRSPAEAITRGNTNIGRPFTVQTWIDLAD
jgi:hypothetical protein